MIQFFYNLSCKHGANFVDWIRTLYFSIIGSTTLTLALKWRSYNEASIIVYCVALVIMCIGFFFAVAIVNRFKDYEKDHKNPSINKGSTPLRPNYFQIQDKARKWQHIFFYTLLFIGLSIIAFGTKENSSQSSTLQKNEIKQIDTLVSSIKKSVQHIDSNTNTSIILKDNKQLKHKIDSLEHIISKR